jgi:ATP-dependent RNA helicase RhlE
MTQTTHHTGRFSDLGIGKNFLDVLKKKGFETPTPIQHQVIPGALEGKDVIGIAQTGTGKTLAFGIPMLQRIALSKGQGLVLVPTRELASQVEEALRQIGAPLGLRTAVVIGGVSKFPQVKAIRRNPHVVIATPGRLADLMSDRSYSLDKVSIITLDEADRMLDVGFLPEIKRILKAAPAERQTLLFSATMPRSISSLASAFMKTPLRIEIAPQGTSAKNVEQEVFIVRKNDKMRLLDSVLDQYKDETTLIFSRTKHGAKRIARDIRHMGHTATEIHGNRSQAQRQAALSGFSKGKFRIMVATDIAARGIDVKDITLVINFDLPDSSDDYVHRIGRTGRAGRHGKAISFAAHSQKSDIKKIERLIRKSLSVLSLPKLPPEREKPPREQREDQGQRRGGRGGSGGGYGRGKFGHKSRGRSSYKKKGQRSSGASSESNSQKSSTGRPGQRSGRQDQRSGRKGPERRVQR